MAGFRLQEGCEGQQRTLCLGKAMYAVHAVPLTLG